MPDQWVDVPSPAESGGWRDIPNPSAPAKPGFWSGVGEAINPAPAIKAVFDNKAGVQAGVNDLVAHVIQSHIDQVSKGLEAWKKGEHVEALGHFSGAALPIVGPAAAQLGEQIGNEGMTAENAGRIVGLIGSVAVPGAIKAGAEAVAPAIASAGPVVADAGTAIKAGVKAATPDVAIGATKAAAGVTLGAVLPGGELRYLVGAKPMYIGGAQIARGVGKGFSAGKAAFEEARIARLPENIARQRELAEFEANIADRQRQARAEPAAPEASPAPEPVAPSGPPVQGGAFNLAYRTGPDPAPVAAPPETAPAPSAQARWEAARAEETRLAKQARDRAAAMPPDAVTVAAETIPRQLLDGLAQFYEKKPFAKLDPPTQERIRTLAKAGGPRQAPPATPAPAPVQPEPEAPPAVQPEPAASLAPVESDVPDIHPAHGTNRVAAADRWARNLAKRKESAPALDNDAAWSRLSLEMGERDRYTPDPVTREMIHERLGHERLEQQLTDSLFARSKAAFNARNSK